MVRNVESIVMTSDGKRQIQVFGLSTDEKPSTGVLTGSVFFEIDTTDVYFYDEDSGDWLKAGGN